MDRFALFVDAGYVLVTGAQVACGSGAASRQDASCDFASLIAAVQGYAAGHCGLPILRTYWYDAAPNATATADHLRIASLSDVKLRLGRLTGGRQKGVDSLIVRDLMTLARERAIATAYLLGGDEDLREGVAAAQDMGMRVVVIGVPTMLPNQAATLINEADGNLVLPDTFWGPHFTRTIRGQALAAAGPPGGMPAAAAPLGPGPTPHEVNAFVEAGRSFGLLVYGRSDGATIVGVMQVRPRVPAVLDAELLAHGEQACGPVGQSQEKRRALRTGFWRGFSEAAAAAPAGNAPPDSEPENE